MSKRENLYQIVVRCSGHQQIPRIRVLSRDTLAAGIDAAIRELRRTRNTVRTGKDFDRWDLYDYSRGNRFRKLLAEGNVYGPDTPLPRNRPGDSQSVAN